MQDAELPELLLIDKPKGITSFDVIRRLRRATGLRKFGHAGTLDPLASGLMLVGVGKGTKKLSELIKLDKEYVAVILLGEERSTGDMEGEIIAEEDYKDDVTDEAVRDVLKSMQTTLTLPVSAYSAIKIDGQPLYKQARAASRQGRTVTDLPFREMKVIEAELLEFGTTTYSTVNCTIAKRRLLIEVRFRVGSGTYIRSLAVEFGKRLGYPATLFDLRRTQVGKYTISNARALDSF